ncbi:MAG: hypothetical protein ABEJ07_06695 [Candidatus Nanohaloarchaea archaeon]
MTQLSQKLGLCVICGDRVHTDGNYLKTSDGYCHRNCVTEPPLTA